MATPVTSSGLKFTDNFATGQNYTQGSNFTAGNTGIVTLVHYGAGAVNRVLSVTIGGTAAVKDLDLTDTGGTNHAEVWRATNMAGGVNTFSFTCDSGSGQYISLGANEFSGLSATPLGQTGNSALGGTASSAPSASTSGATTETDELVVALFVDIVGGNWTSATPPSGYTESWEQPDGTAHEAGSAAFDVATTIGVQTATFATGASMTWVAGIVTYKNAAGGSPILDEDYWHPRPLWKLKDGVLMSPAAWDDQQLPTPVVGGFTPDDDQLWLPLEAQTNPLVISVWG